MLDGRPNPLESREVPFIGRPPEAVRRSASHLSESTLRSAIIACGGEVLAIARDVCGQGCDIRL